jgi:diadenosine tetraphosphatase ApaH/serine/threonine PP2A family protein phosphatase
MDLDEICRIIEDGGCPPVTEIISIVNKCKELFIMEDNVLELSDPVTICGDIHGQLYDLFELFDCAGSSDQVFLFLGDYVDRGFFSVETLLYLLIRKLKSPDRFFMLRGNHESRLVTKTYGFYYECLKLRGCDGLWLLFNELFDLLPLAAIIGKSVFAVHGGLSPKLCRVSDIYRIDRMQEVPPQGLFADLLWSDPDDISGCLSNPRGSGCRFGSTPVKEFCRINGDLTFIARSHQLVQRGFEWKFDQKLITIWSAPNYMYKSGNMACIMKYVKSDGVRSKIEPFGPREASKRRIPESVTDSYFT